MIAFFQHVYPVFDFRAEAERQRERIRQAMAGAKYPYRLYSIQADLEQDTLAAMAYSAWREEAAYYCYVHLKGITHPGNECAQDWREVMEYYVIDCWRLARRQLDNGHDAVGVNLSHEPCDHFSGNFFWIRQPALKKLQVHELQAGRFSAESWLSSTPMKMFSMHDSGVNHYQERYPVERYRRVATVPEEKR